MPKIVIPEVLEGALKNWKEWVDDINNAIVQVLKKELVNKKLHVVRRDLGQNADETKEIRGVLTDIERCIIHPAGLPEFLFVFDGQYRWWVNQFTEIKVIG